MRILTDLKKFTSQGLGVVMAYLGMACLGMVCMKFRYLGMESVCEAYLNLVFSSSSSLVQCKIKFEK